MHVDADDAGAATDGSRGVQSGRPSDDDAGPGCAPALSSELCQGLPRLPADPQLDGQLDCGAVLSSLPKNGWTSEHALPAGQDAQYAVAWRPRGLYFYVRVADARSLPARPSDDGPACGDGVDLYVGYDSSQPLVLLSAAAPKAASSDRAQDAVFDPASGERLHDYGADSHGMWATQDGYVFEAFITGATLGRSELDLAPGRSVALDIGLNVSVAAPNQQDLAECGYRLGQYFLRVASEGCEGRACLPGQSPLAHCSPVLLADPAE
jgi:hypothetical protein